MYHIYYNKRPYSNTLQLSWFESKTPDHVHGEFYLTLVVQDRL